MINSDKPDAWLADITRSVQTYNEWFTREAPIAFRGERAGSVAATLKTFADTNDLRDLSPAVLRAHPDVISIWRMCTAPPIARDRLVGLAHSSASLVKTLEKGQLPPRMRNEELSKHLERMCSIIGELLDRDLFPWLVDARRPTDVERNVAATVVADRLCGSIADPIIRNAQEARQLGAISTWLAARGYVEQSHPSNLPITRMANGTFSLRQIVVVEVPQPINIPVDVVIQPPGNQGNMPILIEAKSAGDFTNTNKRRKEEATKLRQLRHTHGDNTNLLLFLNGYFDAGYLGYEAAEGLDWVWEHRIDDLALAGL